MVHTKTVSQVKTLTIAALAMMLVLGCQTRRVFMGSDTQVQSDTVVNNSDITITDVTPSEGPIAGGTPIIIYGTGFTSGVSVSLGALDCSNIQVIGATKIRCVTPAYTTTTTTKVSVIVYTSVVSATLTKYFSYIPDATYTAGAMGFYWVQNTGYYANAKGQTCDFRSWPHWVASGGPALNDPNVPHLDRRPANLTYTGECVLPNTFFTINGSGYYGSNGLGQYCHYSSYEQWVNVRGASGPALDVPSLPSTMTSGGACRLSPGFFMNGQIQAYANNQGQYCVFTSNAQWKAMGGPDASIAANFPVIPNSMTYIGQCQLAPGFFFSGQIGYQADAKGNYCQFNSWSAWIAAGGPAGGATAVPVYPTIPSSMTFKGICQ